MIRQTTYSDVIRANPERFERYRVRLTPYVPHKPTAKQRAFLMLPHMEAFFGGAAGSGKSDAILMAALQYVDIPGYAGLILRKTLTDARRASSILARAQEWLQGTDVVWINQGATALFPSGARLEFSYLDKVGDCYRYDSAEYQYIAFDELTHFYKDDYEYLLTRLRRPKCPYHPEEQSSECAFCLQIGQLAKVPLRMRSGSNPGGMGHIWVKNRFSINPVAGELTPTGRQMWRGTNPKRPHIPAFLQDNPFIDRESYENTLKEIDDPVVREQKLAGDWGISEEGRFKQAWIRRYHWHDPWLSLDSRRVEFDRCRRFSIIDPAASSRESPGKTELTKKQGSWTVCADFLVTPDSDLLVWNVDRHQGELPEILKTVQRCRDRWNPAYIGMEYTAMSIHLYQLLTRNGLPMRAIRPKAMDKVARAINIANRMEMGKVWFPKDGHWLRTFEDEIFTWIGSPQQTDDQVDVFAYAGMEMDQGAFRAMSVPIVV